LIANVLEVLRAQPEEHAGVYSRTAHMLRYRPTLQITALLGEE